MVIDAPTASNPRRSACCRSARNTPIITFINKMDREVREPLELLSEIEQHLNGRRAASGQSAWARRSAGVGPGAIACACSARRSAAMGDDDLVHRRPEQSGDRSTIRRHVQTGFGRNRADPGGSAGIRPGRIGWKANTGLFRPAINNFGVQKCSTRWSTWAPAPRSRQAIERKSIRTSRCPPGWCSKCRRTWILRTGIVQGLCA